MCQLVYNLNLTATNHRQKPGVDKRSAQFTNRCTSLKFLPSFSRLRLPKYKLKRLYPGSAEAPNILTSLSLGAVTCGNEYKMVRAWYRASTGDDRGAMMLDPSQFVSLEVLMRTTGIVCLKFNADTWDTDMEYAALKESRRYSYEDVCEVSRQTLPDYDVVVKNFATEHLHPDEEIRFVVAGSGYFDIRDWDDRWIRIEAGKDDLLILPAGIYHRFVLDKQNYLKVIRLFAGTPRWTAYFRPDGDDHPVRSEYLQRMAEIRRQTSGSVSGDNVKAS